MEEGIKQLANGKEPHEIKELVLNQDVYAKSGDNSSEMVQFQQIPEGIFESYINLENLTITNLGLTMIKNLPAFSKLRKLDLSHNSIKDLTPIQKISTLISLNLSFNKISKIEEIDPLSSLIHLQGLNLIGNPITKRPDYRKYIFFSVPSLRVLDCCDSMGKEIIKNNYAEADEPQKNVQNNVRLTKPPPQHGKLFILNSTTLYSATSVSLQSSQDTEYYEDSQETATPDLVSDEGNPIVQLLELAKEEPVERENKQVSILEANLEDSEDEDDQEFEPSDEEKDDSAVEADPEDDEDEAEHSPKRKLPEEESDNPPKKRR